MHREALRPPLRASPSKVRNGRFLCAAERRHLCGSCEEDDWETLSWSPSRRPLPCPCIRRRPRRRPRPRRSPGRPPSKQPRRRWRLLSTCFALRTHHGKYLGFVKKAAASTVWMMAPAAAKVGAPRLQVAETSARWWWWWWWWWCREGVVSSNRRVAGRNLPSHRRQGMEESNNSKPNRKRRRRRRRKTKKNTKSPPPHPRGPGARHDRRPIELV